MDLDWTIGDHRDMDSTISLHHGHYQIYDIILISLLYVFPSRFVFFTTENIIIIIAKWVFLSLHLDWPQDKIVQSPQPLQPYMEG